MVFQPLFTSVLPYICRLSIILCHVFPPSHPFYTLDCEPRVYTAIAMTWSSLSSPLPAWPHCFTHPAIEHDHLQAVCHCQVVTSKSPKMSLPSDVSQMFSVLFLCSYSQYHPRVGNISQHYCSHFKEKMTNEVRLITSVFVFEYSVVAHQVIVDFALLMKRLL